LWLKGEQDSPLVLARLVMIGRKPACQLTMLDWPALQTGLAEEIRDLFPEPRFQPVRASEAPAPERAMTALPLELDPGPVEFAAVGPSESSLRFGLGVAWAASLLGLLAVTLGGWALLDLLERRIRFVSAVTHELRTPLTTLRLYLDMLTGGMV